MVTLAAPLLCLLCLSLHQNMFHALLDLLCLSDPDANPASLCSPLNRYNLPVGKQGGSCMIEIAADNGTAQRQEEYVSHPVSEVL